MKLSYYSETDSLYIELSEASSAASQGGSTGVVLDFDPEGNLVGIDIDHTSKVANLSSLNIEGLYLF